MNKPSSGRKRTISDAMDLPHQVSGLTYDDHDDGGRRRRPRTSGLNDDASKVQHKPPAEHQQQSVVPLSMQLLRPFWQLSCCPDCRLNQQGNAPSMLESRARSVSTASFSGLDITRKSEARTPTEQKSSASSSMSSRSPDIDTATQTTLACTELTVYEDCIEQIIQEYTHACAIYGCHNRLNPGVLTCIRYSLPTLRVSGSFFDADMLALVEVLLKHCNGALKFITRLDFSIAGNEGKSPHGSGGGNNKPGFRSHGAYALSRVLAVSNFISEVYLPNNRIGPYGASAIFEVLRNNKTVQTLLMKGCRIGEKGALVFSEQICAKGSESALKEVDLSVNRIGFHGCYEIEKALKAQSTLPINVDLNGNMVLQEVMNSVTHGLGVLLAMIATYLLSKRVQGLPSYYAVSCAVYSTALLVLYTSSTLYHSFFALKKTRFIFKIFDQCAIYILIAGSYSPFLMIALHHNEVWSWHLLLFIWACALGGIFVEATMFSWKHKPKFSLSMYLGMGWCCLVCLPDLMAVLPSNATMLLVSGGIAYTGGV